MQGGSPRISGGFGRALWQLAGNLLRASILGHISLYKEGISNTQLNQRDIREETYTPE